MADEVETHALALGILTNTCTCQVYDEDSGEYRDTDYCDGSCWEDSIYTFGLSVQHLLDKSECFSVSGMRLWNGDFDGYFYAQSVSELVRGMTVNSEWRMDYAVYEDCIAYSLSHHDAPTGSQSLLKPVRDPDSI